MRRFCFLVLICAGVLQVFGNNANPTASFTYSGNECVNGEIDFTNTSTPLADPIVFNVWDFGDGGSSTATNPTHIYASSGTYTVTLTVQDESGDVDQTTQNITINPLPQVEFNFTAGNQCLSTTQTFSNSSTIPSNDLTYSWDFGDMSGGSTLEDPTYDYASTGTYIVKLTATSTSTGCSSSTTKSITIDPDPTATFSFENQCDGNAASFENNSSVATGNLTYTWTFGDGNNSTLENPTNLYASSGDYNVTLTTTTDRGCTDSDTQTISILDQAQAAFSVSDVCLGVDATFSNSSTLASSYSWDFGDGSTSTDENPTHSYEFPGIYEVSLVVSNADGCSDETTEFVEVSPLPVAGFTADDVCLGTAVGFNNQSTISSGTLSYSWDFGDGDNSTATNPSHIYTAAGNYTVQLTVNSENGCSDTFSSSVEIFDPSVSGSISGSTTLCEDDDNSYQLTLSGYTGDILRWESSATGVDQWVTIEHTSATLDYSNLTATTYYRAVVKNGVCDVAVSSNAQVEIDEIAVGGSLTGSASVCHSDNSGTIELSGQSGTIEEWIFSNDSQDGPWTTISNTTNQLNYTDLTQTTYYKVVIANGVCENDTSSVATITVDDATVAGVLSSNATVCSGDNTGTLSLSGYTGDIVKWESAFNSNGPWSTIDVQENTLDYNDLTSSTYYRVTVGSGSCEELTTNQVLISVDEPTIAGEITGTTSVCKSDGSAELMLEDYRGDILKWQSSLDQSSWTDISNTTSSLSLSNLEDTTYFRAEVQNGVCASLFSEAFGVNVNADPSVSFISSEVCLSNTTTFTNTSSIEGSQTLTYDWDFSDGSGSSLRNPTKTFSEAGTYTVKLIVTSSTGCVDSVSNMVTVNENPEVSFSQENVCVGEEMSFVNLSSPDEASIQSYSWDFGDGNTSDLKEPTHEYEEAGIYEVELSITTNDGCTGSITKEVSVDPRPTVDFSFKNVCDGEAVSFANHSSISEGNLTYTWSFGDGETSSEQNPIHLYDDDGSYQVNLLVESENGCTRDATKTITIYNQPEASFIVANECLDSLVMFQNTSIGEGLTYEWSLGDGETSTEQNPTHQYEVSGLNNVTLAISNEEGCSDSFSKTVRIHPLPVVNFFAENVCDTVTASFSNLSSISSGSLSYQWNFGDNATSSTFSPRHLYGSEGEYSVTLTATSEFGCETNTTKELTVHPRPVADFTFEEACDGLVTRFQNTSTLASGGIESYLWEFGDETSAIVLNPNKQFLNDGTYEVSLHVTSDFECESEVSKEVQVFELPIANFDVENVCDGFSINPVNKSTIDQGSLQYQWSFGDGATSSVANPSHMYDEPGIYTITLTASSPNGCEDQMQKDVQIYAPPVVTISKDTTISQGFPAQLRALGGVNYVWSPIEGLSNSNIANPLATPREETTYVVLVTDQFGCQSTDSVTVSVEEDFRLIANNVFTPDGNGQNDFWVIDNVETFGTVNVRVYDRFGKLVFQDEAYQNDWGGTAGNDILPDGTYYYLVTFSDSPKRYSGAITIIRNR